VSWAGDIKSSAEIGTHERNYRGMFCPECYADMVTQETGLPASIQTTPLQERMTTLRRPQSLRTRFRGSLVIGMVLGSPWLLPLAFAASWSVKAQPVRLVNGAPVLFQVKAPARLQSLRGTWLGHEISFSLVSASKTWVGLGGVSVETSPGNYPLELSGETSAGESAAKAAARQISFTRKFVIRRANYPKTQITVDRKFTEPSPDQTRQIDEAKKIKQDFLNRVTPEREWAGSFAAPAVAPISDVFGTQRVFNGKTQSSHLGLDFRVPSGTPVAAMNAGTVLLARSLYFEGNCVVLDHGQGLLTIYMHLSEFKVKEGEQVARGQEVGLSGGTGRATGPHLHVAVRWQGTYLDPAVLITLPLP
jgi:murein DD-endopeptidase MepM/ murein hydrolase activator NlpD